PAERTSRKVEPLRTHLGAEEDVDLSTGDAIQYLRVRPFSARGIDVHARDSGRRETLGHEPLDLLRAEAALPQQASLAPGAFHSRRFRVLAVVADQPLRRAMIR